MTGAVVGTGVVTSLVSLNSGTAPTTDGDSNTNTDLSIDIGLVPQFDLTVAKTSTATVATRRATIATGRISRRRSRAYPARLEAISVIQSANA